MRIDKTLKSDIVNYTSGKRTEAMCKQTNTRDSIKSIERALDIFLLFSSETPELSHAEIIKKMGWSATTTSRYLTALMKKEFLVKNDETGKYHLGYLLYRIGSIAKQQMNLPAISLPVMERIQEKTNETVHLFVRDGLSRVCLKCLESRQAIRMSVSQGSEEPIWVGNTGCVLLTFEEEGEKETLFREIEKKISEGEMEYLRQRIQKVSALGYSKDPDDEEDHCVCIAAPVFGPDGSIQASLGLSLPDFRYPGDGCGYIELVKEGAAEISKGLGFPG